ncbi:venom prothrombin activator pseutarin-C non-catalytic subunit-like [Glandiceps talaboti]
MTLHLSLGGDDLSSCVTAFGMEDYSLTQDQITVSSSKSGYRLKEIRLNYDGSWRTKTENTEEWFSLDLLKPVILTSVAIQGYEGAYATSYYILRSTDGVNFEYYYESGSLVLFSTDTTSQASDSEYIDVQTFTMYTRHFRVSFQSWVTHIMVRAEVYGCDDIRSTCSDYDDVGHIEGWYTGYPSGDANNLEDIYCIDVHPETRIEACYSAMGMEDDSILDSQLSASSVKSDSASNAASQARLNGANLWIADANDANQWLQIDFEDFVTVSRVATQSSNGKAVTEYDLQYGFDGSTFYTYNQVCDVSYKLA